MIGDEPTGGPGRRARAAVTYNLMLVGELPRDRLGPALAALLALPVDAVDIADEDDLDRDWSAPVLCTVSPRRGAVHWHLDVYLGDPTDRTPAEPEAAAWLAGHLRRVLLYPEQGLRPSAYWLTGPDGRRTRARLVDDSPEGPPVYRIDAVERPVAALPGLPLAALPEVIRDHRLPTPIADELRERLRRWWPTTLGADVPAVHRATWRAIGGLGGWEGMVARLAAGWPPDGWYPADYYREDLELRDELAGRGPTLAEPARAPFAAALGEVDRRFRALTGDDGGASLVAELGPGYAVPIASEWWWWRRIPRPVPWRNQPVPAGSDVPRG